MSKVRYILCGILMVLCSCGFMFAGCGNSIDNLSIRLTSEKITESETAGVYDMTLTREESDDDDSWSATVSAEVLNLGSGMSSKIEWLVGDDSRYVSVTSNSDGSSVVIKGKERTYTPTVVTAYSVENRKAEAKIRITTIVKALKIESVKYKSGSFGIPIGVPFSIQPDELFNFYPTNPTVPVYKYTIADRVVYSDEEFTLTGISGSTVYLSATPKDTTNMTAERIEQLSIKNILVKVYTPLSDDNLSLTLSSGEVDSAGNILIIKNAKSDAKNKAVLELSSTAKVNYTVNSPDNIVFDEDPEVGNPFGEVRVDFDSSKGLFTLQGQDSMDDFKTINFNFTIAEIENSLVLTKSFKVRVVDYPSGISINGDNGTGDVTLDVYNLYNELKEKGQILTLGILPANSMYTKIDIELANADDTNARNLSRNLYFVDEKKAYEPKQGTMTIESNTTMYLKSLGGQGSFIFNVIAHDTKDSPEDRVIRQIKINLCQSIETMALAEDYLDSSSQKLMLEYDEYGNSTDLSIRELKFSIMPSNATFDKTVVFGSSAENVVEILTPSDYTQNKITVRAKGPGNAKLTITTQSGKKFTIDVRVVPKYYATTLSISSENSAKMYSQDFGTKTVSITNGITAETLTSINVAKKGVPLYLTNTFYPASVLDYSIIKNIEFIKSSSSNNIATITKSQSSYKTNYLYATNSSSDSPAYFDMCITYYKIVGNNLKTDTQTITNALMVDVFLPIQSFVLNESNVELLANVENSSSSGEDTSTYDSQKSSKKLTATIYPSEATISSSNIKWTLVGSNSPNITLSEEKGVSTTVNTGSISSLALRVSATVVASITDINGEVFTQEVKITVNKIKKISEVYIENYESSLKNGALYFESYKTDTFPLKVTTSPADATNHNLEYIIFDAEKLDSASSEPLTVKMSVGSNKSMYYKILPRANGQEGYEDQYSCKTAQLIYNSDTGGYEIKAKTAGYAFLYIIPQDVSSAKVSELTTPTGKMLNISDISTIKRIAIRVADGVVVPYELYTADDVASVGANSANWDRNYYVMNTIDMSQYINKELAKNKNWSWTPIGNVNTPFSGTIQSMEYFDNEGNKTAGATQNIVGWTIERKLEKIEIGSTADYRNYGIFGVVSGSIKNINFYFNSYKIEQTVVPSKELVSTDNPKLNNFNYGLLVGRLTTTKVKNAEGVVTQTYSGEISNVSIYCSSLSYTYKHQNNVQNWSFSANIGGVGMADEGTNINEMNVNIVESTVSSDDIMVNWGSVIGVNYGVVGINDSINVQDEIYKISSEMVASMAVAYDTTKDLRCSLGGVVGLNYGEVNSAKAKGTLSAIKNSDATTTALVAIGGVVGENVGVSSNTAKIENVLSAVKILSQDYDTIQGGIVGVTNYGYITLAYYDIYQTAETTETEKESLGIKARGVTGGIVGTAINTDIEYTIVQSYEIAKKVKNIISQSGMLGGIVGKMQGGSIQNSFVWSGLNATSGTVAGIVGKVVNSSGSATDIKNVYARGYLTLGDEATGYAFVGDNDNLSMTSVYADLNNDKINLGNFGTQTLLNVYYVYDDSEGASAPSGNIQVTTITRTDMLNFSVLILFPNSVNSWAKDSSESEGKANEGYPYLLRDDKKFIRSVPTSLELSANSFATISTDGYINSTLNFENDTKKIILFYEQNSEPIKLSKLFAMTTDITNNATESGTAVGNININFEISNKSVLQFLTTADFEKAAFNIIGTGTVWIKISSSQNLKAYDIVQICVISGFDSIKVKDESGNILAGRDNSTGEMINDTLKIKHEGSTAVIVEYCKNGEKVSNASGGVKFVTGLKYDASGALVSNLDSADNLISNYKIGLNDWNEGEYKSLKCLYLYLDNSDKIVFNALGDEVTTYATFVIPYLNVEFYAIDSEKNIGAIESFRYVIGSGAERNFETRIYYGVTGISMGNASSGTTISSSQKLKSSISILNDAYDPDKGLAGLLWYELYETDEDGNIISVGPIAYFDASLDLMLGISTDIYVRFDEANIQYIEESAVIVGFEIELSQEMRKKMTSDRHYLLKVGALDEDGEKLNDKIVSLQMTYTPQRVSSVKINHFVDAINTGAKLTQAGDTPTDTIIAGEYGLLRITVSPDYAHFDTIKVTSSTVDDHAMYFDQRVLNVDDRDVYTYTSWQAGVENIENGLSLARVSTENGEFDGNFYIRTICLESLETGTQFTITVEITVNGDTDTFSNTFTVYKPDVLTIEGEEDCYDEINKNYIVAKGTGYIDDTTLEQNKNPFYIEIGSAYESYELSVDKSSADKGVLIVNNNKKIDRKYECYLNTGNANLDDEITVTLSAIQDDGGMKYRVTREIKYKVVDFYIKKLGDKLVMANPKRYAYVNSSIYQYALNLFEGIDTTNINSFSMITFDPSDDEVRDKILETIDKLNGKSNEELYNGWRRRSIDPNSKGEYDFQDLVAVEIDNVESAEWIDGNYKLLITKDAETYTGYKLLSNRISDDSVIRFEMCYKYENGQFQLLDSVSKDLAKQTKVTSDINLVFYQITSQEHPQPIYTLSQFKNMEAGIDYILLDNIEISGAWTPLNTAIRSFNGNCYTIKFDAKIVNSSTQDTNYGLFGTIDADTVIKNVKIEIGDNFGVTNDSSTAMNFGVLAGTNNGTVYNCQVKSDQKFVNISLPKTANLGYNISGLVATNNGGISNSRVECVNLTAGGNMAGLVVNNYGTIASSYYMGGGIINRTELDGYTTAGLVLNNYENALVNTSFVGGAYSSVTTSGTIVLNTGAEKTRDVSISSGVNSAGFVYSNAGTVSDCYSAVSLSSPRMSGFAFKNSAKGKIHRCYSTSYLEGSDDATATRGYPFIGVDDGASTSDKPANNNLNRYDGIVDCYYYNSGFTAQSKVLEDATEMSAEDFCGTSGKTVFKNFVFSNDGNNGEEFSGVWIFASASDDPDTELKYFTHDRFESKTVKGLYTNFGPKLVDASLIATPRMDFLKTIIKETGVEYHYTTRYKSVFTKENNNEDYYANLDYRYDPIVVSNMEQFNNAFSSAIEREDIIDNVIYGDIRIASNLTQQDLSGKLALITPTAQYAGILSGNGFTFNNVSLTVNTTQTHTYYGLIGKLMSTRGLLNENYTGTIKNYNAVISNIDCSGVDYVGGMVGWVENANLYNVKVTGAVPTSSRVLGNNFVGGIAGYVTGTSRVHTAYASVGVTSNYRADTGLLYNLDLISAYKLDTGRNVEVKKLGYAGGLFGVVDLVQFDTEYPSSANPEEARIYNISSDANASIVGKIAGGLIGCVGEYTVVSNATKIVYSNALIRGYVFSGGVVGQNNGYIKYATLRYSDQGGTTTLSAQDKADSEKTGANESNSYLNLFNAESKPIAVGGIVGVNIGSSDLGWPGGTIMLSSSKVAVHDPSAGNAGGIAGAVYGGDIRACLATGSVLASNKANIGGIAGYVSSFEDNPNKREYIETNGTDLTNPFGESMINGTTLDYVVAMNNYLKDNYSYYYDLTNNSNKNINGSVGGIVGFVRDSNLIYTTHSVANDQNDEYGYLTNPINYFISQITNRAQARTVVKPLSSSSGCIDLYVENDDGSIKLNNAVGRYGTGSSINLGQGKTRGYMIQNYREIFAGWDQDYSLTGLDDTSSIPDIVEKELPKEIKVYTTKDLKLMYWHPEKIYTVMNDIDFRDTTVTDKLVISAPFVSIGSENSPFSGTLKGNKLSDNKYPTIKNIYIVNSSASCLGFFGAINRATIQNIVLEDIYYSTSLNEGSLSNVGGLAGVAINSTVENVSILSSANVGSKITTNANNVGGMFGTIKTTRESTMIITDCYVDNNLILTDNVYNLSSFASQEITLGGFAGKIEGKTQITNSLSTGTMKVNYSNTNDDKLYLSVGGFAGKISGKEFSSSVCVSEMDISIDKLMKETRVGGIVGLLEQTATLSKVDSHSKINVNISKLENGLDTRESIDKMYIGGLVGETTSTGSIGGFVVAGDIILNGTPDLTSKENCQVAGIIGNISSTQSEVYSGYSLNSIVNNTLFTNIDMGCFNADNVRTNSVFADINYALTSSDKANVGKISREITKGNNLEQGSTIFAKGTNSTYYCIRQNTESLNSNFQDKYTNMYTYTTGKETYKTVPIIITSTDDFNSIANQSEQNTSVNEYKYYLQTKDIVGDNDTFKAISQFCGSYNGDGHIISVTLADNIESDDGLFGKIISSKAQQSRIQGVVINVNNSSNGSSTLGSNVQNFGVLASEATQYTVINNCYVYGEMTLNITGNTAIGGIVGKSGARYLASATDICAKLSGDNGYSYGAIFGINYDVNNIEETTEDTAGDTEDTSLDTASETQDTTQTPAETVNAYYTFVEVFSAGKIVNDGANSKVAGMIAKNDASVLSVLNSYTMTEIINRNGDAQYVVYDWGDLGVVNAYKGIKYDPSNSKDITDNFNSTDSKYYYFVARNNYDFKNSLGGNYTLAYNLNYGMPVQNWINKYEELRKGIVGTGDGFSEETPYLINTANQFAWMLNNNSSGQYYKLKSDIYYDLLKEILKNQYQGKVSGDYELKGVLDGNDKTIYNLDGTLFGSVTGQVYKLNVDFSGNGQIIGTNNNNATTRINLTGKTISGSLIATNTGDLEITLNNCIINSPLIENNEGSISINMSNNCEVNSALITNNTNSAEITVNGGKINNSLINTNSSTANITVNGGEVNSALITTNSGTATITVDDCEVTNELITTNSGTATITVDGATISSAILSDNQNTAIITLKNCTVNNALITTNSGTATITVDGTTIASELIDTNQNIATINMGESVTIDSKVNSLINTNSGTAIININKELTINIDNFAFVGNSSGVVNLNINSTTTISGEGVSGVVLTYANTGTDSVGIVITLNADYVIKGENAQAIVGKTIDGVTFDTTKNLTYTPNEFKITLNDEEFVQNPTPEPITPTEPSEPSGESSGTDTGVE